MRIALGIEYDGSGFCGWQTQPQGCAAQDALERALAAGYVAPGDAVSVYDDIIAITGTRVKTGFGVAGAIEQRFARDGIDLVMHARLQAPAAAADVHGEGVRAVLGQALAEGGKIITQEEAEEQLKKPKDECVQLA